MMNKYLDFFLTKFSLAYKENSEYKTNLWSAIIANTVAVLTLILFFNVLSNLVSDILNWSNYDFVLYSILFLAGSKIYFIFSIRHFNNFLLSGDLNLILNKPINPLFFQFFNNLRGPVLIVFPTLFQTLPLLVANTTY